MTQHSHLGVVLAVDDETIILWGTATLLESLGYRVVRANSGASALAALHDKPDIDVLLTDFQMPNMTGIELAEAARAVRPELPVIIATGHTSLQRREENLWGTLAKPFTRDELAEAMREAMVHH